jgi:hypothetical protein
MSGGSYDVLYGDACSACLRIAALVSSRRRQPSYWMRSAAVSKPGSMVAAPTAARTWRMDLRTAIEEGVAGVLHEVPTVSDLGGVRERLGRSKGVTAAAVVRDHNNLRLPREPSLRSGGLSVG